MTDTTRIRPLSTADSVQQLTALLHTAYATLAARGWFAQIQRQVCAADRDGMQGASRSNSTRYCEDEQRSRPPEPADAHVAVICTDHPQGWNYTAATQSVQTTRERIAQGQCFVAELLQAQGDLPAGALVGSVCISPPRAAGAPYVQAQDSAPPLYTRAGTAILAQLAVHPALRGQGLGERLCDAAEDWARQRGFAQVALDTAEPATALRARYQRRGYRDAGRVQWHGKTYASVLMCKELR